MNSKNLTQEITETLELCLSKMSKKLKDDFNPEDKMSIKLLQQFRSTLSTFRTWLKQTGEAISQTKDQIVKTAKKVIPNKQQINNLSDSFMKMIKIPYNEEKERQEKLMNQPSGLYYTPTKG